MVTFGLHHSNAPDSAPAFCRSLSLGFYSNVRPATGFSFNCRFIHFSLSHALRAPEYDFEMISGYHSRRSPCTPSLNHSQPRLLILINPIFHAQQNLGIPPGGKKSTEGSLLEHFHQGLTGCVGASGCGTRKSFAVVIAVDMISY